MHILTVCSFSAVNCWLWYIFLTHVLQYSANLWPLNFQPKDSEAAGKEISDVAALAESIQPKGNTLSSTSVSVWWYSKIIIMCVWHRFEWVVTCVCELSLVRVYWWGLEFVSLINAYIMFWRLMYVPVGGKSSAPWCYCFSDLNVVQLSH